MSRSTSRSVRYPRLRWPTVTFTEVGAASRNRNTVIKIEFSRRSAKLSTNSAGLNLPLVLRLSYDARNISERVPRRAVGELKVAEIGSKPQTDT